MNNSKNDIKEPFLTQEWNANENKIDMSKLFDNVAF